MNVIMATVLGLCAAIYLAWFAFSVRQMIRDHRRHKARLDDLLREFHREMGARIPPSTMPEPHDPEDWEGR